MKFFFKKCSDLRSLSFTLFNWLPTDYGIFEGLSNGLLLSLVGSVLLGGIGIGIGIGIIGKGLFYYFWGTAKVQASTSPPKYKDDSIQTELLEYSDANEDTQELPADNTGLNVAVNTPEPVTVDVGLIGGDDFLDWHEEEEEADSLYNDIAQPDILVHRIEANGLQSISVFLTEQEEVKKYMRSVTKCMEKDEQKGVYPLDPSKTSFNDRMAQHLAYHEDSNYSKIVQVQMAECGVQFPAHDELPALDLKDIRDVEVQTIQDIRDVEVQTITELILPLPLPLSPIIPQKEAVNTDLIEDEEYGLDRLLQDIDPPDTLVHRIEVNGLQSLSAVLTEQEDIKKLVRFATEELEKHT